MMGDYIGLFLRIGIIILCTDIIIRQAKQFSVKENIHLKTNLLLISIFLLAYGITSGVSIFLRVFQHNTSLTGVSATLTGIFIFLVVILLHRVYFGRS